MDEEKIKSQGKINCICCGIIRIHGHMDFVSPSCQQIYILNKLWNHYIYMYHTITPLWTFDKPLKLASWNEWFHSTCKHAFTFRGMHICMKYCCLVPSGSAWLFFTSKFENCLFLAFESENRDLKLILRQTEKELEDYKTKYKSQESTIQSQVGEFEDKVFIF